jgi:hypothetical protein
LLAQINQRRWKGNEKKREGKSPAKRREITGSPFNAHRRRMDRRSRRK